MKNRHNKKRNTAFVYESLLREMTACVLKKDFVTKEKIMSVIKKHFHTNGVLYHDLKNYRSLYENQNLTKEISSKILNEAKISSRMIKPDVLFQAQTDLINDINKEITPTVFNTFVPNYKTLATIHQIFSLSTSPKNRVILETQIINNMCNEVVVNDLQSVDSLTLNTFIEKFNEKYKDSFLSEQEKLLNTYITSFVDNGVQFKIFLNEEISRLKSSLSNSYDLEELKNDLEMREKVEKIQVFLESLKVSQVDEKTLLKIMKTQELVKEMYSDAS